MAILVFDIGGTSLKYAIWQDEELTEKNFFKSPSTWDEMKDLLVEIKEGFDELCELDGVAISSPGAVNQEARTIEGISALPYLHHFPIYDELEELFGLPVAIENDANCAALAEVWKGAAKDNKNVLFVVVGTGIGGSVIVDKEVQHGAHLFGGEFGIMLLNEKETFSQLGTTVALAKRYNERMDMTAKPVDGRTVFDLAERGDEVAVEEVNKFYRYLSMGLFNLTYAFDPEVILIGGGVSSRPDLLKKLNAEIEILMTELGLDIFRPVLDVCAYKNDANLIGAVYNFKSKHSN
ncbi:ROK family protein [Marinilactibacillus sp. Marseille-P9653]|uniref:ROK family protein n=1 Tax=Marinilactibacillus sp. Marseille-P9653 TaxID=2866583 RepID=UPI001CE43120|nr:ROK family protein [Marinilactibacillus sp. Marseille-P9653]